MKSYLVLVLCLLLLNSAAGSGEKAVVCYYGTWASYRVSLGKFEVTDIPTDLCTHIVYTFLGLDSHGNVVSLDPYLDYSDNWGKGYLHKFNDLKKTSPHLKTILAVGGYNEGSEKFSLMAGSPKLRRNFITSALNVVTEYGFDGLEVDWEYPNSRDTVYGPADLNNFAILLKELKEELGKRGILVMAAVAAAERFASLSYNVSAISSSVDLLSIMTYNMYGPSWNGVTGHNAPLHRGEGDENTPELDVYSVDLALQYWIREGCPPEKILLGVPFHGTTYELVDANKTYVKASTHGAGLAGPYTQTRGTIGYNEFCNKLRLEKWDLRQDNLAKVPYAVQGKNWVSYDDPNSIAAKVEYGLKYNVAGIMMWSIETDDFHGICHEEDFPLLRRINRVLGRKV